jgi:uncharacterized protein (TIGR02246 family)
MQDSGYSSLKSFFLEPLSEFDTQLRNCYRLANIISSISIPKSNIKINIRLKRERMMQKFASKAILAVLLAACTVSMNASLNECSHQKAEPAIDIDAEKAAVKAVLDRYIQAFQTRNREGVAEVYAHDEDLVVFGSNPLDRRVGWKMTEAYIDKYFASVDRIEIGLNDQRIKVHRSGEAAWFSEVLYWKEVEKAKTFAIDSLRITGVLERRDGRWVIVQLHASGPEPASY